MSRKEQVRPMIIPILAKKINGTADMVAKESAKDKPKMTLAQKKSPTKGAKSEEAGEKGKC